MLEKDVPGNTYVRLLEMGRKMQNPTRVVKITERRNG